VAEESTAIVSVPVPDTVGIVTEPEAVEVGVI
jgi:hypothetical protein